jgi:hypothetical protein
LSTSYTGDGSPRAQSTPARLFREALEITPEILRHLLAASAVHASGIIEA